MTVRPLDGGVRSGAGSRLQMQKSSNSIVSRTPVSSNCFCLMNVVRTRCLAFLPFSLFTPGLLPFSPIHPFQRVEVESACAILLVRRSYGSHPIVKETFLFFISMICAESERKRR